MDFTAAETIPTNIRLIDRNSFPPWYAQLKYLAKARGVWDKIDPDAPAQGVNEPLAPVLDRSEKGDKDALRDALKLYTVELSIHHKLVSKLQVIWNWVHATVDSQRLELAVLRASDQSLHALIKELKTDLCPSDDDWKEQVRDTYRRVLLLPQTETSQPPERWLLDWTRAHANAVLVDLDEIKGVLPIKDFLRSAARYQQEWAARELDSLARPGARAQYTLQEYARWFSQLVQAHEARASAGAYATFGGAPNTHSCPCRTQVQHKWKPTECARLQFALQGRSDRELRNPPTSGEVEQIKSRLKSQQYEALRAELRGMGWNLEEQSGNQYPGSISA